MKHKNLFFYVYCFLFFLIIIFLFNHLVIKPFPFFKVDYYKSLNKFNAEPINEVEFYNLPSTTSILPSEILEKVLFYEDKPLIDKIKISTEITRSIQEQSLGNIIKNYNQILNKDEEFWEICSEASKIFVFIMDSLNETSRIIWMNGHTVVEVWDENQWIFVDPSSNTIAIDKFKNKISLSEVVILYPDIEFKTINNHIDTLWDYRSDSEKLHNILNNIETIFVINNNKVFSFHEIDQKIERIFSSIFFNNNFIAKQFIGFDKATKVGNFGINLFKLL
jgi:hypothetical protein